MLLNEIAIYRKGKPAKKAESGNILPILTPEYLRGKGITETGLVTEGSVLVEDNDVVLLWDGSNAGEFFKAKKGILASTMVKFIFSKQKIDESFFYYQLKYHEEFLKQQTNGSGIPHVDKEFLQKIKFTQTDKAEQTRIAQILSKADEAIVHTEALIAKYQRIKTGLMQDLLTRGIDEHGNIRSEETHIFKDRPLGRIPVEWEVSTLETEAELVTSGSRGWAKYYSIEGSLFLRIGNLTRRHINFRLDDVQRVTLPVTDEGKRTLLREGDILISITADLGIIGVVPKDFEEAYINQHIALVRIIKPSINPRFVGYFLSSTRVQNQLSMSNDSGAKAGLNLPTISKVLFSCPGIEEQDRIATLFDKNNAAIESFKLSLTKLQSLKRGLMQDLLSGAREAVEKA